MIAPDFSVPGVTNEIRFNPGVGEEKAGQLDSLSAKYTLWNHDGAGYKAIGSWSSQHGVQITGPVRYSTADNSRPLDYDPGAAAVGGNYNYLIVAVVLGAVIGVGLLGLCTWKVYLRHLRAKPQVMISYRHLDTEFAKKLERSLLKSGFRSAQTKSLCQCHSQFAPASPTTRTLVLKLSTCCCHL
jgi:hypothetical protein